MGLRENYETVRRLSPEIDAFDVVKEVERYRLFWKPQVVRVVLLAESHVRTSPWDFAHHWSNSAGPGHGGNFVRFVYCLAYGESSLVDVRPNPGTWQYWELFFSCLHQVSENRDFAPILKGHTYGDERIRNKVQLLHDLQAKGVWLVDASFVGINRLRSDVRSDFLRACWRSYTGPLLKSLDPKPEHVIVIGKGVKNTLYRELNELGIERTDIPQPQAHIPGGYWPYYRKCFEACSKVLNGSARQLSPRQVGLLGESAEIAEGRPRPSDYL